MSKTPRIVHFTETQHEGIDGRQVFLVYLLQEQLIARRHLPKRGIPC